MMIGDIGNSKGTHDMYLPDRRARPKGRRPGTPKKAVKAGNPKGTLAEKCEWMRAFQAAKRKPAMREARPTKTLRRGDYNRRGSTALTAELRAPSDVIACDARELTSDHGGN